MGAVPLEPVPAVGGGYEEMLCKKEQLNDLEKPNCFPALGLLEKVIHFLEGKSDHVIYCLNQDSFMSERGTRWMGHWASDTAPGELGYRSPCKAEWAAPSCTAGLSRPFLTLLEPVCVESAGM